MTDWAARRIFDTQMPARCYYHVITKCLENMPCVCDLGFTKLVSSKITQGRALWRKTSKIWRFKDYIMICKRQESNHLFGNSQPDCILIFRHRYEWFSGTNSGRW